MLAVADNLGKVRILSYPAYLPKQAYNTLDGHTNKVTCASFMPDDSYLVTAGENDCALLIWAYKAQTQKEAISSPVNLELNKKSSKKDADLNQSLEELEQKKNK